MNGYYINLEERKDRYVHFEKLKTNHSFFKNVNRVSAIKCENGAIGCGLSHIKALKKSIQDNDSFDYTMVFEDDFCILNDTHYTDFVGHFEHIRNEKEWDIIVLTPRGVMKNISVDKNCKMTSNHFYEIVNNQTATGYIIKKSFIPILISTFEKSVEGLLKKQNPDNYAIDQYWKSLQNTNHFYYFKNVFAGQLPGYSTIEKRMVDYNERFISQK